MPCKPVGGLAEDTARPADQQRSERGTPEPGAVLVSRAGVPGRLIPSSDRHVHDGNRELRIGATQSAFLQAGAVVLAAADEQDGLGA